MFPPERSLHGESPAPADALPGAPARRAPLSWRDIIEGAGLAGPLKSLASQAQVIALEPGRVQLRLGVQSLLTDANRRLLEARVSAWLGRPFRVTFEAGEAEAGSTVADAVRAQKTAEHKALVERFRRDPVVEEIVRRFGGVVDEASVKAIDPASK